MQANKYPSWNNLTLFLQAWQVLSSFKWRHFMGDLIFFTVKMQIKKSLRPNISTPFRIDYESQKGTHKLLQMYIEQNLVR